MDPCIDIKIYILFLDVYTFLKNKIFKTLKTFLKNNLKEQSRNASEFRLRKSKSMNK